MFSDALLRLFVVLEEQIRVMPRLKKKRLENYYMGKKNDNFEVRIDFGIKTNHATGLDLSTYIMFRLELCDSLLFKLSNLLSKILSFKTLQAD